MGKNLSELSLEELWQLFPIILEESNPLWKDWYREEADFLCELLGAPFIERMNHIGSTAVVGLLAKPTIDILLEVKTESDLRLLIDLIESAGYICERQPNKPAPHLMFMKGYTESGFAERVFHLHVRYVGDWDELYFRDYLKKYPDVAHAYAALKSSLSLPYRNNRDGYTDAKHEFVSTYSLKAKQEFTGRYQVE